ncbi:MAG TPA: glutaredoxin family protein [Ramlibacter sp.]|nr:glutaredoxin family protein [Ramlibacter sp.]
MSCVRRMGGAALLALAAVASAGVAAQQIYRIVGPDGRVTFSDKPPATAAPGRAAPTVVMPGGSGADAAAALPFELRSATSRYPVTLYTSQDCGPCGSGRNFLASRGIPFSERTVSTEDDIEGLRRLAGAARLPFLTIGAQQLRGFSEPEWSQYLDAAGYPRVSQLPSGYRNPPPAPLVATQQAPRRAAPQQPAPAEPQQSAVEPAPQAPANPAGIRF